MVGLSIPHRFSAARPTIGSVDGWSVSPSSIGSWRPDQPTIDPPASRSAFPVPLLSGERIVISRLQTPHTWLAPRQRSRRPVPGGSPILAPRPNIPTPRAELSEVRQILKSEVQIRKELADVLRRAKEEEIRQRAYANVTGQLPPEVLAAQQARQQAAAAAFSYAGFLARKEDPCPHRRAGVSPDYSYPPNMLPQRTRICGISSLGKLQAGYE